MKKIVSIISILALLLSMTVCVSPITASASATEAPSWITIVNPAKDAEIPFGMPLKALFTTTPRGDLAYVKLLVDGQLVKTLEGGEAVDGKMSNFVTMTEANKKIAVKYKSQSAYVFIEELPAAMLTPGHHTIGVVAYENGFGWHAPATADFYVMDYPEKQMKTKTHGMNLANFGGSVTTTTNNDYTGFPVSTNNAAAVSAVAGADVETNENDKAIGLSRSEAGSKPALTFYVNGTYNDSNRIKGDRIIFSSDVLVGQSDVAIAFEQVLSNTAETYFRADGTIIGQDYAYTPGEWKNMVIDMNYPEKALTLYYDGLKVRSYTMSDTHASAGTARIKVELGTSTVASAAISFDNFDVYTVAPYASEVKYTKASSTYSSGYDRYVAYGAESVIMPLTGAYNADTLEGKLTLKNSEGTAVEGATVAYDSDLLTLTANLPTNLNPGTYMIEVAEGAGMTETRNTTQHSVSLAEPHCESFTIYALDEIGDLSVNVEGDSALATIDIIKQPVDSVLTDEVTVVIAAYSGNKLTAVSIDKKTLSNGQNALSSTLLSLNGGTDVKAFVWENISGMKPITIPASK